MANKTIWETMAVEMLAEIKAGKTESKRLNVDGDTEVVLRKRGKETELSLVRWCRQATPEQRSLARRVFGVPDEVAPKITYSQGWGNVLFRWGAE